MRPKKANFGVDCMSAVKQRYELELNQAVEKELKISRKSVKMLGFESFLKKQR